jgi:hypothetical protein
MDILWVARVNQEEDGDQPISILELTLKSKEEGSFQYFREAWVISA